MAIPLSEGEEVRGRIVQWSAMPPDQPTRAEYTARAIHLGGGILVGRFRTPPEVQIPLGWRVTLRFDPYPARQLVAEVPEYGIYAAMVERVVDNRGGVARVYGDEPPDEYVAKMIQQRAEAAGLEAHFDRDVRGVWIASVDTGRGTLSTEMDPEGVTLQVILRELGLG